MARGDLLSFEEIPIKVPEAVATPPASIPRKVLDYETVHQEQAYWCWAAVTLAVTQYYAKVTGQEAPALRQCDIVNADLAREDCCDGECARDPQRCNRVNVIYNALTRVGHYADCKARGKPELSAPRLEIDEGRPLVILIKWKSNAGHFAALYGYDESAGESIDDALLHVADPWYGPTIVTYGSFPETYQVGGTWSWSYWTKPAEGGQS